MNARYYSPRIGRFITKDPLLGRNGDLLTRNRYVYAKNNPFKYVDPSGEKAKKVDGTLPGDKEGSGGLRASAVLKYILGVDIAQAPGGTDYESPQNSPHLFSRGGVAENTAEFTDYADGVVIFTGNNIDGSPELTPHKIRQIGAGMWHLGYEGVAQINTQIG